MDPTRRTARRPVVSGSVFGRIQATGVGIVKGRAIGPGSSIANATEKPCRNLLIRVHLVASHG
ncbi:hypothetical protein ACYOEI_16915 [Singulisphaera rosea]